jgi:hypothetical protein
MKVHLSAIMLSLLAIFISSAVLAQERKSLPMSSLGVAEAPIGHRQPRASDVPTDQSTRLDAELNRANREINKKVRSICRGC